MADPTFPAHNSQIGDAAQPVRNKWLRWVSIPVDSALPFRKDERSGGRVAIDRANQRGSWTFLEDSKFFFTLYHAGKVNIFLHLVSFSFLFYGLTVRSVSLVLSGLFIFDEMGHAYNYLFVHNRDPRFGLRMIPYQFLYGGLIMLVLLKLFGWV